MLELHELSRIGFGGYRISRTTRDHYQALSHALASGCNLIDTAANYTNGESEKLIGEVLANHPEHESFIITPLWPIKLQEVAHGSRDREPPEEIVWTLPRA